MEVKKGYKQTDLGVIPSDWKVKLLSDVAFFTNGKAHERHIDNSGNYIVVNSKFISTEGEVVKKSNVCICPLKIGDITMVMSDIPNGKALAKCFIIPKDDKYTLNQRICSLRTEVADNRYLSYILNRNKYYLAFDSGTGQTNLRKSDVLECPVAIPPTKAEQTAIAATLSDADALIQSMEKLIAKKRLIKQGAMQELLKPKEGWVVKKLGEVAVLKARIGWQGLTTAEYKETGDYYLITGTDFQNGFIDWENCFYVEYKRYKQDKNIQVKENDVLVTKDGTIGKVAFIKHVPKPATLNSGVFVIRPIEQSFHPEFFYYLLLSEHFAKFLFQLSAGSTINHLYQKDFVYFEFQVPKTNEEQTRIATILSDMDAEISTLETKLAKYKQVKQGMMQNLLTGKIRLVENALAKQKVIAIDKNTSKKNHNWQINEAVVIAVLTKKFGSDEFPLGRKRYTKLSYLLHRYIERQAEGYLKKAAGPYNPATRYKGPESIAQKNKYIMQSETGQYSGFVPAENIAMAEEYFNKWYGRDVMQWLKQFKYEKNDTLELWATVDMAVQDLKRTGKEVSTEAVKSLINNTKEWKPKLKRPFFSDENIAKAILKTDELFKG